MKTYTLQITRQQALTLQVACEMLARLGIGQFRDALDHLPTREFRPEGWHEDMDAIGAILSKYTVQGVDGWRHSLGISNDRQDRRYSQGCMGLALRHSAPPVMGRGH